MYSRTIGYTVQYCNILEDIYLTNHEEVLYNPWRRYCTVQSWRRCSTILKEIQYNPEGDTVQSWRRYSTILEEIQYNPGGDTAQYWRRYSTVQSWRRYSTILEEMPYNPGRDTVQSRRRFRTIPEEILYNKYTLYL